MNLYLISQDQNNRYDTYDSAVVVAESFDAARLIHPSGDQEEYKDNLYTIKDKWYNCEMSYHDFHGWCKPEYVSVKLIGSAQEEFKSGDVICASFNAG